VQDRPAIEALERATDSSFFLIRAIAGVALSVDAAMLSCVRRLTVRARRPPVRSDVRAPDLRGVVRVGILCASAATLAAGAVVATGELRGPTAPTHTAPDRGSGPLTDVAASTELPPAGVGAPPPSLSVAALATPLGPDALIYVNPLAKINNLVPQRIDQGVDYGGSGPLLALGSGIIRQTSAQGWPAGVFIALQLDNGPLAGRIVYYAENVAPTVRVGQHVNAGDVVGTLRPSFPHLEIGWGGGGVGGGRLADALARTNGPDVEGVSTALGFDFSGLLVHLGAPGGIDHGLTGHIPAGWGTPSP
jgi:hypothetical protein